ncbi:hypothetical protein M758_4G095600 [Ceratodon purpureus]|nr:hypothetical protein M758_4G095600 [Ceratodon purpureus]
MVALRHDYRGLNYKALNPVMCKVDIENMELPPATTDDDDESAQCHEAFLPVAIPCSSFLAAVPQPTQLDDDGVHDRVHMSSPG